MTNMAIRSGEIHITGPSLKPWIAHLERLENEPNPQTVAGMEAILLAAYAQAFANTHVVTGRLVNSMDIESQAFKSSYTSKWSGTLHIGEGVRYAKYEVGDYRKGTRTDWAIHPNHSQPFDDLVDHVLAMDALVYSLWD